MTQVSLTMCLLLTLISFTNRGSKVHPQYSKKDKTTQVAEKAYLHIDRVLYNSGDDVWFKAYVIDPSTNKLSLNTNNLHVELIALDSKIIMSRTIRIERGIGNGDFNLPDSVPSGQYRIRAYTNHMRNYDERFFFLKEITIINPYDDVQELNRNTQSIENKIDISFFPEGGSLVDNVTSTVAFKAVNALGKGCDVTGELYSSLGKLITTFKSTHLGLGSFNIKPVPGLRYYAVMKSPDGSEIKTNIPESFPEGVNLSTRRIFEKKLLLTVSTNEVTFASIMGSDLDLYLSSRNLINKTTKIKITSLVNKFILPIDDFPDGIIKITLSGIEGLPVCERLFYLQKNNEVHLNVVTDKKEYKPREKVTVGISLSGDSSLTGAGDFSFSAAENRFTDNSSKFPTSIASWFLLESDVHGPVEEPSYYFDPSNENRLQDLDLLLLTQGWRDFQWKYDSLSSFRHEIGFTITGNVIRTLSDKPIAGTKINMGIFGNIISQVMNTETDSMGFFRFEGIDLTGIGKLVITTAGKNERIKGRIFMDSLFYDRPEIGELTPNSPKLALLPGNYFVLRQEAVVKSNIKKKYKLSDTIDIEEVFVTAKRPETPQEVKVRESRRVYTAPDKELKITPAVENYAGDVFSFLSGRIAGVRVARGVNPCSLYYPDDAEVYIREQFILEKKKCNDKREITIRRGALILLDGYEIDPSSLVSLLTLPMNFIDRIDVLNASALYGMRGANGVVNIITRTGIRRVPDELAINSTVIRVKGFDAPRIFYSPKYNIQTPQAYMPDIRTTIYWEPDISLKTDKVLLLNYFNADNSSTIRIVVEGITSTGIPVTGRTEYEVR